MEPSQKPQLGVSACLLGHEVRYDGGHKEDRFINRTLPDYFDLLPVCPEVELGLGVPRPTIHLTRFKTDNEVRLINPRSEPNDLTQAMQEYATRKVAGLGNLCGYIFKKNSPSCGIERVPITIDEKGNRERSGTGLFAQVFMEQYPLVPVEEEGRLNDPGLRENFFERLYALQRWRDIPSPEKNVDGFIQFHAGYKFLILARGDVYYRELGRLVAGTRRRDLEDKRDAYIHRFMQIMSLQPSRGRHVNVMQHLMGFFKKELDTPDKNELLDLFERYRQREIPIITPLTLLKHHLRRLPDPYLSRQYYLSPYPESLGLRSHVR